MSIWEIISEIRYEFDEYFEKYGRLGILLFFLPHCIGALIAAGISQALSLPGASFIIMAAIFFFVGGLVKSLLLDKQSVFVSFVKNFFMTVLFAAVGAVGFLIISII